MTTTGSSGQSYAEWYCALFEPIRSLLASHGSNVTVKRLGIHIHFISKDKEISARSRMGTGQAELVGGGLGQCLTGQNRTKTGQVRTGQGRMRWWEAAFLDFSPSDILVDHTRVSALPICPICPISQRTFVWFNFLAKIFFGLFLSSSSSCKWIFRNLSNIS